MSEKLEIYKCNVCGSVIEVINAGVGQLVCCSLPMELLPEHKNDDEYQEKHVPIVSLEGENKTIRVGSIPHPMEEKHNISFVYVETLKGGQRKSLLVGEEPKVSFTFVDDEPVSIFAYCNLHGLWKTEIKK